MSGFTVEEGLAYFGAVLYDQSLVVENLTLGLFTNLPGTLTLSSVWPNVTQASGAGYAEIPLTPGTFVVDAFGVVTYPQQQWTATGDWAADVQGYYIRNQAAGFPQLVHVQYRDDGGFPMTDGQIYTVDLSVDTS